MRSIPPLRQRLVSDRRPATMWGSRRLAQRSTPGRFGSRRPMGPRRSHSWSPGRSASRRATRWLGYRSRTHDQGSFRGRRHPRRARSSAARRPVEGGAACDRPATKSLLDLPRFLRSEEADSPGDRIRRSGRRRRPPSPGRTRSILALGRDPERRLPAPVSLGSTWRNARTATRVDATPMANAAAIVTIFRTWSGGRRPSRTRKSARSSLRSASFVCTEGQRSDPGSGRLSGTARGCQSSSSSKRSRSRLRAR